MENIDFATLFQGFGTMMESGWLLASARVFLPVVWLVTEAEQQEDGDWLFFGYCHIQEWEWGYVLLSQIQEVNVRGLTVQLDKGLKTGITVKACLN